MFLNISCLQAHPSTVLGSTERLREARGNAKTMTSKMPSTPWDTKVFIRSVASTLCNTMPRRIRKLKTMKPSTWISKFENFSKSPLILRICLVLGVSCFFSQKSSGLPSNMKLWSTVFVETFSGEKPWISWQSGRMFFCQPSSNVWDAYKQLATAQVICHVSSHHIVTKSIPQRLSLQVLLLLLSSWRGHHPWKANSSCRKVLKV